tara:strand:- start:185 stop:493 length:309 start_codon:yes stop_codon:yes gene_type:complete
MNGVVMTDNLPAIITSNGVDVTPVFKEMIDYLKEEKELGNLDKLSDVKVPMTSSADWKLICGVLCNSIVEWASQNANDGGKDLIVHMQSDIGYLVKRLGLVE